MTDNRIRMQCPMWERSSRPGLGFNGSIAIDNSLKRLLVYDDIKWPSVPFPELVISLTGVGVNIRFKPIKSRNDTHKMGKMTVTTSSTATVFPSILHADEVFTFLISLEDSNTIIGTINSWME
ncbi:hypothetical protein FRACYDRAFT_232183 [Fragilariopsis cylindrus CCMP1102]|uniref:Uncharacterized protein n=1 Tax=Fragilariopsis cylindrus CCMP1102 TaxID=635003 RepID=A0A1E7FV59_9STRA|nr:hypothetical protein FRACYDRAFT_232183 [Fragilariopsis cylindrus CCMP1102]|eukprot:OEU22029.1 hypothetical protein FRACYDRAFT_232183 [Fragilariopsis cylindrus CCMP1102]